MGSKKKGGLTKADLVDVVYDRHGALTKNEAAEIVSTIFGTVKQNLGTGRAVRIKNFGVFEVADRKGRMGVNPASGEKMFIPPHKGLAFRPSTRLKKQVLKKGVKAGSKKGSRKSEAADPAPERPSSKTTRASKAPRDEK